MKNSKSNLMMPLVAAAICAATGNAATENIINYNTPGGTFNYDEGTTINKPGVHQRILVQSGTVNINEGAYVKAGGNINSECNYVGVDNTGPAYLNINGGTVWCATDGGGGGYLAIGINNYAQPATVTLNSGLLRVDTQVRSSTFWNTYNGSTSSGTLVVNGGEAVIGEVAIGADAYNASGGTSALALNGGSLTVGSMLFLPYNGQVFTWGGGTLVATKANIFTVQAYADSNKTRTMEITGTPATFNTGGFAQALPAFTGTGGLTVTGAGGSIAVSGSQAFTGDLTLSNDTALVMTESATFAGRIVLGGANSKIRVDTANSQKDVIVLSATGYSVPSGDILDYVELTDSANFTATFSGNMITVTRLRQNEPDAYLDYVESDGRQWVNLSNLTQTATMTFDADMEWKSDANGAVFIGQSWHARNMFMVKDDTIRCMWFMGDNYAPADTGVRPGDGQRHRFVVTSRQGQKLSVTVDGGDPVYTANNSDRSISNPDNQSLYLFAQHQGGGNAVAGYSSVKLYGLKVYGANGGLVLDFVPGIKNGVAGLYDRVYDVWYVSGSGTALIAAPVRTPTSPTPTEFFSDQQTFVTLECATAGATIYYTTDGSDPTTSSTVYSAPFAVTSGTTVKARAYMAGLTESAIYSATFTFVAAAELTHRWSFNGEGNDYSDSITGGTIYGTYGNADQRATTGGKLKLTGGQWGAGSLVLGANILGDGDATLEIWAALDAWNGSYIPLFDYGGNSANNWAAGQRNGAYYTWSLGTDYTQDAISFVSSGAERHKASGKLSPFTLGTEYHFAFTFKDNGDGSSTVKCARRNSTTGALEKSYEVTVSNWTLKNVYDEPNTLFGLGLSHYQQADAKASFNEVRIWNGVVGDDQLAANAAMGPDVYTAGLENGFTLADNTVFNVPAGGYAASGIVTLGAGSKLRFDTSSIKWEPVSFSARGFTVPSGSILNYVEPADSSNFSVTFSNNTITVTRLRQNEPDVYIDYVQSDGRQAVDTGVTPGPTESVTPAITNMTVDADLEWISGGYMLSSNWNDFHPLRNVNGKIGAAFKNSGGGVVNLASGKDLNSGRCRVVTTVAKNQPFTIDVDGTTVNSGGNTVVARGSGRTLYAFASNSGSAVGDGHSTAKLYGMKIYINGVLERDFVPGIKNGVAGLYDRQNDEWRHSGSGIELIPGSVVNPQNLPDAYLDYVKSTGTQWVNLNNLTQTRDIKFDVDVDWISGVALIGQGYYDQNPLTTKNGEICCKWYMSDGDNGAHTGVTLDSGRHRFVVTGKNNAKLTVSVDGCAPIESRATSSRTDMGSILGHSLYLFAQHSGGGSDVGNYSTAKLYGLKIYGANGALMCDYIPGIKDNVAGLYDRVSDKFVKSGSGTPLVAGPVVDRSKPDSFVEYVESNGSQWVDTGVDGRAGVKSEADIDWISGAPLGVYGKDNNHCFLLQGLDGIGGQALGSGEVKTGIAVSGRHLIVSEVPAGSKMTITVDGTTTAQSAGNVSASGNTGMTIWMFAVHHYSGSQWGAGNSKFYGLKLWRTGSDGVSRIQRHFIPCVKGGRAGLYDAVSGVIFYSHSGTDLVASSTTRTLSVWRNEADDASLDNAANWCGGLPNGTDAVVCAPWVPSVSATDGFAFTNLTVSGGNLAFADGTNTVAGALVADGALAFTNLVINGSADCAVAVSGVISGHGTVNSLTLAEGARFIPDGVGYLTVSDALDGTMLIDMTGIDLSGSTDRFPLFKTGTEEILPAISAVEFVGGRAPSGRLLLKVSSGFGYDLGSAGFFILLR